jgi:hypothetical protein
MQLECPIRFEERFITKNPRIRRPSVRLEHAVVVGRIEVSPGHE